MWSHRLLGLITSPSQFLLSPSTNKRVVVTLKRKWWSRRALLTEHHFVLAPMPSPVTWISQITATQSERTQEHILTREALAGWGDHHCCLCFPLLRKCSLPNARGSQAAIPRGGEGIETLTPGQQRASEALAHISSGDGVLTHY